MEKVDVQAIFDRLDRAEAEARKLKMWLAGTLATAVLGLGSLGVALALVEAGISSSSAEEMKHIKARLDWTQERLIPEHLGSIGARSAAVDHAKDTVYARRFEVVDRDGKTIATLDAGGLGLGNADGTLCAGLGVSKEGGILTLNDTEGGPHRVWLTAWGEGPRLSLRDKEGTECVRLSETEYGGGLALNDAKGERRTFLGIGGLALNDSKGTNRVLLDAAEAGAHLTLYDAKGAHRADVGASASETPDGRTTTYPESTLTLWDADGKMLWQAPMR